MNINGFDHGAIAQQLGLSKEEMIARFGEPGTKTPEEIGSALGMDHNAIVAAFGEKNSTDSGDSFVSSSADSDTTDSGELTTGNTGVDAATRAKDDEIKNKYDNSNVEIDARTYARILEWLADGTKTGGLNAVAQQCASELDIPNVEKIKEVLKAVA